jgi:sterol desaturase/sphingolipid hydroxylase (fatty acid hydroxylase superfamily)
MFYMVLVIFFIGLVTETYVDGTLLKAKEALGIATPWITQLPFLVQVFMVMLIFEFGQYWMHRFMHNNELLWSTHAPHHHVTQLNALKGFVGNPIELFLISLGVIALFDFDLNALLAAFLSLGAIAQYAHANIRSDPPAWYAFFFTTIRHHSLHHTALSYEDTRCNYGNSVILWDRLFGTFREGESEVVGQDDRRRLSIPEQFAFPYTYFRDKRRQRLAGE